MNRNTINMITIKTINFEPILFKYEHIKYFLNKSQKEMDNNI